MKHLILVLIIASLTNPSLSQTTESSLLLTPACTHFETTTLAKSNCKKFLICIKGVWSALPCPTGLLFSSTLKKCDYRL